MNKQSEEGEINWRYQVLDAMKNADTYFAEKSAEAVLNNLLQAHTAQRLSELKEDVQELADEINNAINSQKEEGREVPDWLKGKNHAYVNVLQLIEETCS